METENLYYAIAESDLYLNDFVLIVNGKCKKTAWKSLDEKVPEKVYCALDNFKKGSMATLAGEDTIFYIQEDK